MTVHYNTYTVHMSILRKAIYVSWLRTALHVQCPMSARQHDQHGLYSTACKYSLMLVAMSPEGSRLCSNDESCLHKLRYVLSQNFFLLVRARPPVHCRPFHIEVMLIV